MTTARAAAHSSDVAAGQAIVEIRGVTGLRGVRLGLMDLAVELAEKADIHGYLVLLQVSVTLDRLRAEWTRLTSALRPDVVKRLTICVGAGDQFIGIPHELHPHTQTILSSYLTHGQPVARSRASRGDAAFVILKTLLHHWFTNGTPVTTSWLADTAGFSYPTVANALAGLGSLIERLSDRRVRLRWFPRDQFARLVAVSERARGSVRYADRSSQPRTPEAHVRRLEKLRPPNIALGGVIGAAHYFPELDLAGVPRLDLSQHVSDGSPDLAFVEKLDPALKVVDDPIEPATVVVHQVRHANSLFTARDGGLQWADPVECLLDLHEAHLDAQATQFLKVLERSRPKASGPRAAA